MAAMIGSKYFFTTILSAGTKKELITAKLNPSGQQKANR
jgi:hypothetical protein